MADFKTTCIDKKDHLPASYDASHTQCTKCNQEIYLTNEGSGYYFSDFDCKMWDIQYNGVDETND